MKINGGQKEGGRGEMVSIYVGFPLSPQLKEKEVGWRRDEGGLGTFPSHQNQKSQVTYFTVM